MLKNCNILLIQEVYNIYGIYTKGVSVSYFVINIISWVSVCERIINLKTLLWQHFKIMIMETLWVLMIRFVF